MPQHLPQRLNLQRLQLDDDGVPTEAPTSAPTSESASAPLLAYNATPQLLPHDTLTDFANAVILRFQLQHRLLVLK